MTHAKPLEYQLVDLLSAEGVGDNEAEAIRALVGVVCSRGRKMEEQRAREREAALQGELRAANSRLNYYFAALCEIANADSSSAEIAERVLRADRANAHSIAIRVEVSPLGKNGLVKLTTPAMPKFTVVGKTEEEVLLDAPLSIAALINDMQGVSRAASAIEAPSGVETGNTDSTEGESAVGEAETPKGAA